MGNYLKYYCLLISIFFGITTQGQYLCDEELHFIKKQKKIVQKKAKTIANSWILANSDDLNIPNDIKLSQLNFEPKKGENWDSVDSLLCVKKDKELINKAIQKLQQNQYVVYHIRAYFNFPNTINPEIRSMLYFDFDINGNLIRAVIREKEFSPFSETYYH
ncbi:MAG: hypothetical protein CO118_06755 [Flavobacteriales bacterium CG_4_9_14_3_um_filter_32_8]|nr:MAG: hypothetical protein CO118_06755 [Flavobacteriales bacterium CG_4_9_14_3_um_filter_32_8]